MQKLNWSKVSEAVHVPESFFEKGIFCPPCCPRTIRAARAAAPTAPMPPAPLQASSRGGKLEDNISVLARCIPRKTFSKGTLSPKLSYGRYFQQLLKNLSVQNLILLAQILSFLSKKYMHYQKKPAKRLRTTSLSCQGRQIFNCCHAKNQIH